jgi:hypothetical protein
LASITISGRVFANASPSQFHKLTVVFEMIGSALGPILPVIAEKGHKRLGLVLFFLHSVYPFLMLL